MNDLLFFITFSLLGICTLTILIYWKISSSRQKKYNEANIRLDNTSSTFANLDTIIETSVGSINQKIVSPLKNGNQFVQSDKEEAFNECRKIIYSMTPSKTLEDFRNLGIDVEAWINTRIEYFVRKLKK